MYNNKINVNIMNYNFRQTVEMESNFWTGHKNEDEEEFLLANVVALRSQLKETERSLQNLGEELSRYVCM